MKKKKQKTPMIYSPLGEPRLHDSTQIPKSQTFNLDPKYANHQNII